MIDRNTMPLLITVMNMKDGFWRCFYIYRRLFFENSPKMSQTPPALTCCIPPFTLSKVCTVAKIDTKATSGVCGLL